MIGDVTLMVYIRLSSDGIITLGKLSLLPPRLGHWGAVRGRGQCQSLTGGH